MKSARIAILALFGISLFTAMSMQHATDPDLSLTDFASIPGWQMDDHREALAAFMRSCTAILGDGHGPGRTVRFGGKKTDWIAVCEKAGTASDAKNFFEANFIPLRVSDPGRPQGLFTGYYEPEADGSLTRSSDYDVPIYRRPADLVAFTAEQEAATGVKYGRLVAGTPEAYPSRREIEQGALAGRGLEIVWLKDWADAYFIQVQGSGRVRLPEGTVIRLAFAAKSGRPYTGIGAILVDRGVFPRESMSLQAIREWMAKHQAEARNLMWQNESYIFFRDNPNAGANEGPPGAQHVPLTPGRSLAVDRTIWMYGTPMWIDSSARRSSDANVTEFRRLMIAQDTGTAIRGLVRGDVFWGSGKEAEYAAGHMKSPGTMTVLLPSDLTKTLLDSK